MRNFEFLIKKLSKHEKKFIICPNFAIKFNLIKKISLKMIQEIKDIIILKIMF